LKNKAEEDTKTSESMRGAGHASALSPTARPNLVAKVSPRIFGKGQNDPALATDIRVMQEAIKKRIQDNKEQLAGQALGHNRGVNHFLDSYIHDASASHQQLAPGVARSGTAAGIASPVDLSPHLHLTDHLNSQLGQPTGLRNDLRLSVFTPQAKKFDLLLPSTAASAARHDPHGHGLAQSLDLKEAFKHLRGQQQTATGIRSPPSAFPTS